MKKRTLAAALLALALCSPAAFAAPEQSGAPQILWQAAGTLSPAQGQTENIGVAGMIAGMNHGYIIAGGGANFPHGGPATGGAKVTYADVYVMKANEKGLTETDHQVLPFPAAYGASVTTENGVYYIGGSPDNAAAKKITRFTCDKQGTLHYEEAGTLPFAFQNGIAAHKGTTLYLGLGKQDGQLSRKFYAYDLTTGKITPLADFPGEAREQSVAEMLGNTLCVFSGGSSMAYTDGYGYDLTTHTWHKLANVAVKGQEISLLGARAIRLNDEEMLVIGGFNKEIYDDAVAHLSTLKGDDLAAYKTAYFGKESTDFHWNRQVLVYNARHDAWRSAGEIPFAAPCGEGLVKLGDKLISLNGEIKPGVRSNRIYEGFIRKE